MNEPHEVWRRRLQDEVATFVEECVERVYPDARGAGSLLELDRLAVGVDARVAWRWATSVGGVDRWYGEESGWSAGWRPDWTDGLLREVIVEQMVSSGLGVVESDGVLWAWGRIVSG